MLSKQVYSEKTVSLEELFPNFTHEFLEPFKGIVGDRSTVFLTPYFLLDVKTSKKSRISITFSQKLGELALKHEGRPVGSGRTFAKILKQVYGEGINTILDIKSAIDPHDIMNPESLA